MGSTHKYEPHAYGVSYFSSRGPTADGRMKPDLVAPGERIESALPQDEKGALDGTSQAAPHVSAAAAMLMARYPELNREPRRIKQILCDTATDLGRERAFQATAARHPARAAILLIERREDMAWFTLEALPARYGDCLLLHYGDAAKPGLVLIDGGPGKVWEKSLQPRLKELAARDGFRINLMMVSHIDDDHVVGLVAFTGAWKAEKQAGRPWPYPVREAWHNSFERIQRQGINAVTASVTASAGGGKIDEIDLEEHGIENSEERRDALKVLASVTKGKALRDDLEALGVPTNSGFDGHLVRPGKGPSVPYRLGAELTLHIAAPLPKQLDDLQKEFAKELKAEAALAAYTDGSVPNLSSIAVLASFQARRSF